MLKTLRLRHRADADGNTNASVVVNATRLTVVQPAPVIHLLPLGDDVAGGALHCIVHDTIVSDRKQSLQGASVADAHGGCGGGATSSCGSDTEGGRAHLGATVHPDSLPGSVRAEDDTSARHSDAHSKRHHDAPVQRGQSGDDNAAPGQVCSRSQFVVDVCARGIMVHAKFSPCVLMCWCRCR